MKKIFSIKGEKLMSMMNSPEVKKAIARLKNVQEQVHDLITDPSWVDDARKYAERQSKEIKKLIRSDADKVKKFVVRERKELEKFQKQIPGEVAKLKKYLVSQRKEFEKLLKQVTKASKSSQKKSRSGKTGARRKSTKRATPA